jgi:3-methyladenine DNA glycosylase/8-oxoguanine DNA glycosylase
VKLLTLRIPFALDLPATLGGFIRGYQDPTASLDGSDFWRATRTPDGTATLHLRARVGEVEARAWGKGADFALAHVPDLIGFDDDPSAFEAHHPILRDAHRRMRGLRIGRTGAVMEALVASIIEQKVTGKEAFRSHARLVRTYGETAPGPMRLFVAPDPKTIAALPSWAFHPLGIERRRADTVRRACARASRLEEVTTMAHQDAYARLRLIQGVGVWTAAEVGRVALGDPDAVAVGDYHLKNVVAYALTGEPRGTDEQMLELLEPYRGQRGRAIKLLEMCGPRPPRFGPRMPLRDIARI